MAANDRRRNNATMFDTDAKLIRIDNCASYSISNDPADFATKLKPVKRRLKGLGGMISEIQTGTIRWEIQDDDGMRHTIKLPNSLYVKSSPSKLLSPQHWAQSANDNYPKQQGTWCATYQDKVVLHWNQRRSKKTIRLDPSTSSVATLHTAPGYRNFEAFCAECEGGAREMGKRSGSRRKTDRRAFPQPRMKSHNSRNKKASNAHDHV